MTRKRLRAIARELEAWRSGQPKATDLIRLAKRLGRELDNRGSEPMYVSTVFAGLFPLAIPMHKGRDYKLKTRNSILNQLDGDVVLWEARLDGLEQMNGNGAH